jgi:hypothetical protein
LRRSKRDNGDCQRGRAHALPGAFRAHAERGGEFAQNALRCVEIDEGRKAAEEERGSNGFVFHG